MRRALSIVLLLVCFAAPAFGAARPALHLVRRVPVEVRGAGFRPHERVTVTSAGVRLHLRSSSAGAFVAKFPFADRCSQGRVVATGASGGRAVLYIPPVECPVA